MKTIEAVQCEYCKKLHPKENIYDYVIASFNIVRINDKTIADKKDGIFCNECLAKAINKALSLYHED